MDDYPRAPANAGELHLDLHCWMGFFSRTMREIAEFIGAEDDLALFTDVEQGIKDNLEDLHWNEEEQMYCDVGVNDDGLSFSSSRSDSPPMTDGRSLFLPQTSPTTSVTKATSPSSPSSSASSRPTRPTSARSSTSSATRNVSGRSTASAACPRRIPSSARARTTGRARSGSR